MMKWPLVPDPPTPADPARATRIVRRVRRQTAARDLFTFGFGRMWMSLLGIGTTIVALATVLGIRTRGRHRPTDDKGGE